MLNVVEVVQYPNQILMVVDHQYTTGWWIWRRNHVDRLKFMTNNGIEWRDVTGDGAIGRVQLLSDDLHKAYRGFQWPNLSK